MSEFFAQGLNNVLAVIALNHLDGFLGLLLLGIGLLGYGLLLGLGCDGNLLDKVLLEHGGHGTWWTWHGETWHGEWHGSWHRGLQGPRPPRHPARPGG